MKKLLVFGLLLFTGCAHKESHDIVCVADFSIIPYHTHTQGPVFVVTIDDQMYLTFKDAQGNRKVFDKSYQCDIGE